MKKIIGLLFVCTLLVGIAFSATYKPGYVGALITGQLEQPTSIAVAPDGRIFVAQKEGKVRVIENGQLLPTPFVSLQVDTYNERGLGSILLDEDFDNNGYVYMYYSVANGNRNRLSRFTASGNVATPGSERVLIDFEELGWVIHNGGAMRWGPDGKIYLAVGDGGRSEEAASLNSMFGKMLRINKDGSIPTDNPFYNSTSGKNRFIYALGFRNPFTFDVDPASGRIFVNDVGDADWEEINEVLPGKDYGWPAVEGPRSGQSVPGNYQDPLHVYSHEVGCAIVGGAVFNSPNSIYPPETQNHYFFADFCEGTIVTLDLQSNEITDTLVKGMESISNMVVDTTTGTLLFCELWSGNLFRLQYIGTGPPFITQPPQSLLIPVGETATFSIEAVAVDVVSYQWQQNGADLPGEIQPELLIPNTTLSDSGSVITCRVFNAQGDLLSDPVILGVTTNQRPVITISAPAPTLKYKAGDMIRFTGTAVDPESGMVPPTQKTWWVDFHHNVHFHPFYPHTTGLDSGFFQVPYIGEVDTNVWFRIHHTAVDDRGMEGSAYVDIYPKIGRFRLKTQPPGLDLIHNGKAVPTPAIFPGVPGMERVIEAPEYAFHNDSLLQFEKWGTTDSHLLEISIPDSLEEYVAHYRYLGKYVKGEGDGLLNENYNHWDMNGAPILVLVTPQINFFNEIGPPSHLPPPEDIWKLGVDTFGVRWTGDLLAPVTGTYTFDFVFDDLLRFYLDGECLIDAYKKGGEHTEEIEIDLEAGVRYPVQIDYGEMAAGSQIFWYWKHPFLDREIVPQSQLYSSSMRPEALFPTDPNLWLFPVPLEEELHIQFKEYTGPFDEVVTVEVLDLMGKVLVRTTTEVSQDVPGSIDVSELERESVYIVRVFRDKEVVARTVLKW